MGADKATGVTLAIRVIPRSSRNRIAGRRGDALVVKLTAPPVEGAANSALVEFLAEQFECPRRDVTIASGHASRDKRVTIAGVTAAAIDARLSAILARR